MTIIDQSTYESEVARSGQPALLCFFKNTVLHSETARLVEELSRQYDGSLPFYAVTETDHEFFFGKFNFLGTPIFIFLENGIERRRLLGEVSQERLRNFIDGHMLGAPAAEKVEQFQLGA